ncbi:chorismate-binding protein, partial [Kutzneria sp. 744]|uniref:chorismate-binding protein n=1 Tax=Kutzneria sp. (strain 744) TaxID=345341 RepID=UPI0035107235
RYAGPVGWVDASGDGEVGIALRCAQVADSSVRLFAGGGVVPGFRSRHRGRRGGRQDDPDQGRP